MSLISDISRQTVVRLTWRTIRVFWRPPACTRAKYHPYNLATRQDRRNDGSVEVENGDRKNKEINNNNNNNTSSYLHHGLKYRTLDAEPTSLQHSID